VLQCVAVRCSMLRYVAVVLQCVAVVLHLVISLSGSLLILHVAVCCSVLQCVAVRCSALQCVAVCYSMLRCVPVCSSVLQCIGRPLCGFLQLLCVAVCCSALQCVAVPRSVSLGLHLYSRLRVVHAHDFTVCGCEGGG